MKWMFPVSLMILCGLIAGCGSTPPDVLVVDRSGSPIAGAKVEPVAPSINYNANTTDKKGELNLPARVQEVKWLDVSAPGFKKAHVDYTGAKPQRVVLDR
ncbi:carboxypeptidase-like regulatory domain-containing protein [Haloferula sp. BvORR071]|uniref:carboxypeptidase-like regulatory domain-containing protein n=1 Tax=Haloferula sp. BvORR071 TaxID=1396141 RepID=UPI00224103CD|nr:carboxypeptidase-like regulatory domain-containing protein [Haloferula sp. BvORR071]